MLSVVYFYWLAGRLFVFLLCDTAHTFYRNREFIDNDPAKYEYNCFFLSKKNSEGKVMILYGLLT